MTTLAPFETRIPIASTVWTSPGDVYTWLDDMLHQHAPQHVVVSSKFPTVAERVADHLRDDPSWTVATTTDYPRFVARRDRTDEALCLLVTCHAAHTTVMSAPEVFPFHLELFCLDTFRNSKKACMADMGVGLGEWLALQELDVTEADVVTALFGP